MAFTLLESVKPNTPELKAGVIQTLAGGSKVLQFLPFFTLEGRVYTYNREATLPGIAFRGLNESYTASAAVFAPQSETLTILGGEVKIDTFDVRTDRSGALRAQHTAAKVKAFSREFARVFFEGNNQTTPREFDGLKRRLNVSGSQVMSAGTTNNGVDLTLDMLDELIDKIVGMPSAIYMSLLQRRKLTKLARSSSNHQLEWELDRFGEKVTKYDGIEIHVTDEDDDSSQTPIVSKTEFDQQENNQTTTSIYAVRFASVNDNGEAPDGEFLQGLRWGGDEASPEGIIVKDFGEVSESPNFITRVEGYTSIGIFHPRSAARLRHLKAS
jgi:hypothetical protein